MKRIFLVCSIFLTSIAFAKKWDAVYISKLITKGGIDKVIDYYKARYNSEQRDPQDAFRIADLYVKKKDYASAVQWYDKESQLINTSKVNLFNYANANRLMGEYQKALDGYLMYAALTGDVDKVMDLANQCEKVIRSSALAYTYKLDNYPYNTANDEDYVALLRNNAVYITQPKTEEKVENSISQTVRLFDGFAPPVKAYYNNIPKLTISGLSYTKDGNKVVFAASEEKISSKKGKPKSEKLYIADNLGGRFLNVKPIVINKDGFTQKSPAFNADGTKIYFSSNMPGGQGGFDIWETDLVDNQWSTPKNLGSLLNSSANEINPFISQSKSDTKIYFASDRDGGFGGYDLYAATTLESVWQGVEILPAPINAAGNDISIIYDNDVKTGYFCSDRTGGKGGYDLYRFTPFNLKMNVTTRDTFSEKPIGYALLQLFDGTEKLLEGVTDENGNATFSVNKNKNYTLKITKDNYRPIMQKISSTGKESGDSIELTALLRPDELYSIAKGATTDISLDNFIIFTGKITDAGTNKVASKVKMRMVNYATQKVRQLEVDSTGNFEIKLFLNNNYKVIFENQENKIVDELTTYGMDKNTVKIRDYILNGNKLKFGENRTYNADNLPAGRKITLLPSHNTLAVATPTVAKNKVDSLINLIAVENKTNPIIDKTQKTTTEEPEITATPKPISASIPEKTTEAPIVKIENEVKIAQNNPLPTTPTQEIKTEAISAVTPVATATKITEDTTILLAADMATTGYTRKVKVLKSENLSKKTQQLQNTLAKDTLSITTPHTPTETVTLSQTKGTAMEVATKTTDKANTSETNISNAINAEPTNTIASDTTTPQPKPVLPDVYYKVQLASYDEGNLKFPEFENIGKVEEVQAYNRYIYRLGDFETLEKAKQALDMVRTQGYFVAFILQYNKGKVSGIIK